jgi:hypothetical protein
MPDLARAWEYDRPRSIFASPKRVAWVTADRQFWARSSGCVRGVVRRLSAFVVSRDVVFGFGEKPHEGSAVEALASSV